ncbi:hypothetical protein B0H19DRAFT_1136616 [Mycena capillaripes]|nr:hypothetical protein B0H19DRAFT_1136616 [Mycena capillaripes]
MRWLSKRLKRVSPKKKQQYSSPSTTSNANSKSLEKCNTKPPFASPQLDIGSSISRSEKPQLRVIMPKAQIYASRSNEMCIPSASPPNPPSKITMSALETVSRNPA